MKRTLSVNKERLTELATDELVHVAGAQPTQVLQTLKPRDCIVIQTLQGCTTAIECP